MASLLLSGGVGAFSLGAERAYAAEGVSTPADAVDSGGDPGSEGASSDSSHETSVPEELGDVESTEAESRDEDAPSSSSDQPSEAGLDAPDRASGEGLDLNAAGEREDEDAFFGAATRAPRAGDLPAVFATGGSGRFKESIQWLQWADYSDFLNPDGTINLRPRVPVLDYNQTRTFTNVRDMGDAGELVTTCKLSNLTFIDAREKNGTKVPEAQAKAPLVATIPGTWAGDALDNMYNVGGAQGWKPGSGSSPTYPADSVNPNRMVVGLANGYAYVQGYSYENPNIYWKPGNDPTGMNARVSLDVECGAKLRKAGASDQKVPLAGLVFADSEASSDREPYGNSNTTATDPSSAGWEDEWVQARVPAGTTWRVLDRLRSANCKNTKANKPWEQVTTNAIVSADQRELRLMPSGEECVYQNGGSFSKPNGDGGPDVVTFMEGATKATITMQGAGYSAVALGLVIATDFGDAPESYGKASSLFQPVWSGGEINSTTDAFGVNPVATMGAAAPRLGATIDAEGYQQHSDDARGDDKNGIPDDEDALGPQDTALGFTTAPGERFDTSVACTGPGKVAGWVDWNHNGVFDDSEKSDEVTCSTSGSAVIHWSVPNDVVRSVSGESGSLEDTYMRLRITNDNGGNGQRPIGNTTTGEVEDYRVSVRIPTLQLVKEVQAPFESAEVPALAADKWTLTAQQGSSTDPLKKISGAGGTEIVPVSPGVFALSELSAEVDAVGYEATTWRCGETAGTRRETGISYSSSYSSTVPGTGTVTVKKADRVTCQLVNRTKPGSISWRKVESDGTTPLGGTTWKLTGPDVPAGTVVSDCTASTCPAGDYTDQDPAKGAFKVKNLKWGTYSIQEASVLPGYKENALTHTFPKIAPSTQNSGWADVELANPIVNERLTGSVKWTKVDGENGQALSGSSWSLTGGAGLPAGGVIIEDCVAASAQACPKAPNSAYYDVNPTAGTFEVKNLAWTDAKYRLKETQAPAGYVLREDAHDFTITADDLDYQFGVAFKNFKTSVPSLPLTGGMSADSFLIFGGGGLLLAAATALAQRRGATARNEVNSLNSK